MSKRPRGPGQKSSPARRRRVSAQRGRGAQLALRNIRIGGFMGIENKFVDYEKAATTVNGTWANGELDDATALSLSSIAQGDGESNRDGRKAELLSVHVKGLLRHVAQEADTNPPGGGIVRLILVLDKQTNGAQLNAEDVVTVTTIDVNAWRNLQNSQRFRILKDQRWQMKVTAMTTFQVNDFSTPQQEIPFEFHVVFKKPIVVNHTGTTAVVASIADNSLHLIGVSTIPDYQITYVSRVRFRG